MKQAIVIGALGFIGFALTKRLLAEGFIVIGIDCMEKPIELLQEQKLSEIARNSQFTFINGKLEDLSLTAISQKCDVVYYCLLDKQINEYNINEKIKNSKKLLHTVMVYCQSTGSTFIYLSTYEVFSENEYFNYKPNQNTPRNLIGLMKATDENEIEQYRAEHHDFSFLILQLPTIYGPWQPENMTFQQLIKDSSVTPTVDPIQEDVVYIYDLVDMLLVIFLNGITNKKAVVGSNQRNLWQQGFALLTGSKESIRPKPIGIELRVLVDNQLVNSIKQTTIEEGIAQQKNHYDYLQKLKSLGLI